MAAQGQLSQCWQVPAGQSGTPSLHRQARNAPIHYLPTSHTMKQRRTHAHVSADAAAAASGPAGVADDALQGVGSVSRVSRPAARSAQQQRPHSATHAPACHPPATPPPLTRAEAAGCAGAPVVRQPGGHKPISRPCRASGVRHFAQPWWRKRRAVHACSARPHAPPGPQILLFFIHHVVTRCALCTAVLLTVAARSQLPPTQQRADAARRPPVLALAAAAAGGPGAGRLRDGCAPAPARVAGSAVLLQQCVASSAAPVADAVFCRQAVQLHNAAWPPPAACLLWPPPAAAAGFERPQDGEGGPALRPGEREAMSVQQALAVEQIQGGC